MGRFYAETPTDREALFADAISEFEARTNSYITFEVPRDDDDPNPWIQYRDGIVNIDVTEAEYDRLTTDIGGRGDVVVESVSRPDDADGINVRLRTAGDPGRIAACIEAWFLGVFDLPESYRVWVAEM